MYFWSITALKSKSDFLQNTSFHLKKILQTPNFCVYGTSSVCIYTLYSQTIFTIKFSNEIAAVVEMLLLCNPNSTDSFH